MRLYMAVTPDDLELPLAVAASVPELSEMVGHPPQLIRSAISKGLNGKILGMKFLRIIEED